MEATLGQHWESLSAARECGGIHKRYLAFENVWVYEAEAWKG